MEKKVGKESWKKKGEKWLGFTPLLGAILVVVCMGISLYGYETPTYAAADETIADEAVEETEAEDETEEETEEEDTAVARIASNASVGAQAAVSTVVEAADYRDGTYYGSGAGFAGTITVKVVISGGAIASIEVTDTKDGSSFVEKASQLLQTIITLQTTNVDTISGATYSSKGMIEAVRNALSQAAVDMESGKDESSAGTDTGSSDSGSGDSAQGIAGAFPYVEGIYYGTAEGYQDDITVAVVIQDETIKAILITEAADDEAFLTRAKAVIHQVMEKQSTEEIDLVSGATYSSNGILGAIRNALLEAEKATSGTEADLDNQEENAGKNSVDGDGDDSKKEDAEGSGDDAKENSTGEKGENTEENDAGEKREDADDAGGDGGGSDESGENVASIYLDGVYAATAFCMPDEDGDFAAYRVSLKITIKNDKIVAVSDVKGDGGSTNDTYLNWAANGRAKYPGVVTQVLDKGTLDGIDTVSRATCSSKSILEACEQALASAKRKEE